MQRRRELLIAVLLLISTSGCAIVHHYGSYMGKVVDKETGESIEGAAVLAVYYTREYTLAGSNLVHLDAQDTLTDENGDFKIPCLTSFTFRPLQSFQNCAYFTIFKPGYGNYPDHDDVGPIFTPNGTLPENEYVVIELPRVKTLDERASNIPSLSHEIPFKKQKQLIQTINQEHKNLGYGWYYEEKSLDKLRSR